MNWMMITLLMGTVLAAASLFVCWKDAQRAAFQGGGGFESHQVPLYPMLTGLAVCILLACAVMAREQSRTLSDCSAAILVIYCILYFTLFRGLQKKRNAVSGIPAGTAVRAVRFARNSYDLAGTTAEGTVLLEGKEYRAFVRMEKGKPLPAEGDILHVEGTDGFYLLVR